MSKHSQSSSGEPTSPEQYVADRQDRQRTVIVQSLAAVALSAASLVVVLNARLVVLVFGLLLVGLYLVGRCSLAYTFRKERAARNNGAAPSWPARLPVMYGRQIGAEIPSKYPAETVVVGRLVYEEKRWRWEPNRQFAKLGVGPAVLDGSTWHVSDVKATKSIWNTGYIKFRGLQEQEILMWIRRPDDVRKIVGGIPKQT